ncbi:hypothetical protein [Aeromicrobium sp.]|uniref:hypothetical protein n=1 Tax=Aeromicrobium sp. TaxID=1871063 RepID=UPI0030C1085E
MRVVVVMMMVGSLFGCGGSEEPNPDVYKRADATKSAAAEVFPLIGEAVKASSYTSSGGGRWDICGMEPSPTGAEYVAEVAVTDSNTVASEQADLIASALTSVGWKVEPPTSELVEASKDGLQFAARYGDLAINLSIRSGCVDSSANSSRKLSDKRIEDLGLPLSAE